MTIPGIAALDHLLIGAPALDLGIKWLFDRTGVRAALGGSHPGLGTWNALASLGPQQYVEIIAPDPEQSGVETFYIPGLRNFEAPRVTSWAARTMGIRTRFPARTPLGFSCDRPREGSRVRLDGSRLEWALAFPLQIDHGRFDGLLPFLIDWQDTTTHPGAATPPGLSLRSFSLHHPNAEALRAALRALDLDAQVEPAKHPSIRAVLDTPQGIITV